MEWVKGIIIPLVSVVFIGGILSYIGFILWRGFSRVWHQQIKWIIKYKIKRKTFPDETVKWCLDCIDRGIGYYDSKKLLFIHNGHNMDQVYETLYIYDQIIMKLHHKKNKRTEKEVTDGRKFERSHSKIESTKLPSTTNNSSS